MSGNRQAGLAGRLRRWIQVTALAYKSWTAVLGSVLGCIALCNLVFRLFDVSISESLRWLLIAYQQTFHPPIAFIFSWLPFALAPAAKDAILLYLAIGGVLYRTITYRAAAQIAVAFSGLVEGICAQNAYARVARGRSIVMAQSSDNFSCEAVPACHE